MSRQHPTAPEMNHLSKSRDVKSAQVWMGARGVSVQLKSTQQAVIVWNTQGY